jgi:2,5-diketo-D-gluconate reductase B
VIDIPKLGLGTWLRDGHDGFRAIVEGLELGYRHLDTAQTYGTEGHIGRAIRTSGVPREEVFVTTKVGDVNLARQDFLPSLRRSLDLMDIGPVDLTLIHWPARGDSPPLASYMEDLAEAKAQGLTRLTGVSNFPGALVERSVTLLGPGEIVTNQVEVHPFLQNRALRACCEAHGIVVTAYMPLAGGRLASDPTLRRIAERHGVSPPVVTLTWLFQHGMFAIPASGRRDHMAENLRALELTLGDDEMTAIDALHRGLRLIDPAKAPVWD